MLRSDVALSFVDSGLPFWRRSPVHSSFCAHAMRETTLWCGDCSWGGGGGIAQGPDNLKASSEFTTRL